MEQLQLKPAIVINEEGYKVEFVGVFENGKPFEYLLNDNEKLIFNDIETANSMVKPRLVNGAWQETAIKEEIEIAKPVEESQIQPPCALDLAIKELTMAMEQIKKENDMAIEKLTQTIQKLTN